MGEGRPALHEPVEIRRVDIGVPEGRDRLVALIVGEEKQHVRFLGRPEGNRGRKNDEIEEGFHV